ncbi:MAG: T9SS type A sorting domain-containing protein [Bacteroidota bacterium]
MLRPATLTTLLLAILALPAEAQWVPSGNGITGEQALSARAIHAFPDDTDRLIVYYGGGGASGDAPAADAGVYRSDDGGVSWTQVLASQNPRVITSLGGSVFVATVSDGMYRSDDGTAFLPINNGIARSDIFALTADADENVLYAGSIFALYRSFNNGLSWTEVNDEIDVNALYADGQTIWAGDFNEDLNVDGIYVSPDFGQTWESKGLFGESVSSIFVTSEGTVLVGVFLTEGVVGGLFRSTNNGDTWTRLSALDDRIDSIVETPTPDGAAQQLWAGGSLGTYISTDDGATWTLDNAGFPDDDASVRALAYTPVLGGPGALYAAERFTDVPVYTRAIAVAAEDDAIAQGVTLSAAFPNPFADRTELTLTLDRLTKVVATVYDVLGREVASLADGQLGAGEHGLTFEASNLPTGLYLVHLLADGRSTTRTLTVAR